MYHLISEQPIVMLEMPDFFDRKSLDFTPDTLELFKFEGPQTIALAPLQSTIIDLDKQPRLRDRSPLEVVKASEIVLTSSLVSILIVLMMASVCFCMLMYNKGERWQIIASKCCAPRLDMFARQKRQNLVN